MQYLDECKQILEQLKKDYPLPEKVRLRVDFQESTGVSAGGAKGAAGVCTQTRHNLRVSYANIYVAMLCHPITLVSKLRLVAHEYRHAYQGQVLGIFGSGRYNCPSEVDARDFAEAYVKEYLATHA